jgi:hypothetical protein
VIFAGLLLVHETVLGPGGLAPVTGVLVIGKRTPQYERTDIPRTHPNNVIDITNTTFVKSLYVMLKSILTQKHGECPFGHLG